MDHVSYAQTHALYRLSCSWFAVLGVGLLLWRPEHALFGAWLLVQSALSFYGDVVRLQPSGHFWPDVARALGTFTYGFVSFDGRVACLTLVFFLLSGTLFSAQSRAFVWAHAAWHGVALLMLAAECGEGGQRLAWLVLWGSAALHCGAADFAQRHALHDLHAVAACLGICVAPMATINFSLAYFVVEVANSLVLRDPVFVLHGGLTVAGVCLLLTDPYAMELGWYWTLWMEASTPLLHWWQRDTASFPRWAAFAGAFFVCRVLLWTWLFGSFVWNAPGYLGPKLFCSLGGLLQLVWFAHLLAIGWAKHGYGLSGWMRRTYLYNICWEDPAVDHALLSIEPDDTIFRIASAGDVVLDYALAGPRRIVCCDLNPHQLYLLELKVRMLEDPDLTHDEWWAVWGVSDADVALRVWRRMRHTLSFDAQTWWAPRLEATFRAGFAWSGACGWVARRLLPLVSWGVGWDYLAWREAEFSASYGADAIRRGCRLLSWVMPRLVCPCIGVPVNQVTDDFGRPEFYADILTSITADQFRTNYFYRFYFEGRFPSHTCAPRTLQPQHFEALRRNVGCLEWHLCTVQQLMERTPPATFTKVVLLDHLDWMSEPEVAAEWAATQRASVPGALALWRSAGASLPPWYQANLDVRAESPEWYARDRVKTYLGTWTTTLPTDPLPRLAPQLSACHHAPLWARGAAVVQILRHGLRACTPTFFQTRSSHAETMEAFYAPQSTAYDALRESMLVARPRLMAWFGPVRSGHTWLDVGGGTGRNVHYMRPQLARFQRIVVVDVCRALLRQGEANAKRAFGPEADRIEWLCVDATDAPALDAALGETRFDTVTCSYSLSMIPDWERALDTASARLAKGGRVLVADFDTYADDGRSCEDALLRGWYARDGVRIAASTRRAIEARGGEVCRFRERLLGVALPHFVGVLEKNRLSAR